MAAPGPGLDFLGDTQLWATGEGRQLPARFGSVWDYQTVSVVTRTGPIAPDQAVTCFYTINGGATTQQQDFFWDYNLVEDNRSQWYTVLGPFPTGTTCQFRIEASGQGGESLVDDNGGLKYDFISTTAPQPEIFSISPTASTIRGNDMTNIFGDGYTYGTRVFFGSQEATADKWIRSATWISLRPPEAEAVGKVNVAVATPGKATRTLTLAYEYVVLGNNRPKAGALETLSAVTATNNQTSATLPPTGGSITAAQTVHIAVSTSPIPPEGDPQWTTLLWSTDNWATWDWTELNNDGDAGANRNWSTDLPLFAAGSTVRYVVIAQCQSGGLLYSGANANTPYSFNVTAAGAPTVTGTSPALVTFLGGQALLIAGTNFTPGTTVTIDGQAAAVVGNTGSELRAITPAGTIGQQRNVVVTVPGHAPITRNNAFGYTIVPENAGGPGLYWCGDVRLFITDVGEIPATGGEVGSDQTVSIIAQAWPQADGQTPWIVWSTNGFTTTNSAMMNFDYFTGNNTQYWIVIGEQPSGSTVQFFITMTGAGGEVQSDTNAGAYFGYTVTGAAGPDLDGDGVPDSIEGDPPAVGQSNRLLPDSDLDGLEDGEEDANANGLQDTGETSTRKADSDNDGLQDGVELLLGTDPLNAGSPATKPPDADADGLPDSLDPNDASRDADGDRYDDLFEAVNLGLAAVSDAQLFPSLGDANRDGFVSNIDALIIQSLFLTNIDSSAPVLKGEGFKYTDLNGDGFFTNLDALVAQSFFLTNVPRLPWPR